MQKLSVKSIIVLLPFILILALVAIYQATGLNQGEEGFELVGTKHCKIGLKSTSELLLELLDGSKVCGIRTHVFKCIHCGNGVCEKGEDICNCPTDCL